MRRSDLATRAREVLLAQGWGDLAIRRALSPTPAQRKERPYIPISNLNPEQCSAVEFLRREGWFVRDIAAALNEPEREISFHLARKKYLNDIVEKLTHGNEC